ncbi:ribonuclease D [Oceanobacter mangrovi]|uniref:ribonuclease D n=1 Tax=Oceanobacter mangrovi TaxID=2862510 RepID=UPI001C8D3B37|nr:ribonuclease D [Oceanobacter mangrovi]
MTKPNVPSPVWLTSNEQLASACEGWLQQPFLAMDTEFVRTTTFFPQAGLLQVADDQQCYLIDPLVIDDWSAFAAVLQHSGVTKVFHACAEDLEVCRQLTGVLPSPLADSQLAAAMAGLGSSLGFQKLIMALLDIEIDKEETRSNWLARPLTDEQIQYAVADVHYLHQIYPMLEQQLQNLQRLEWLQEDCARIIDELSEVEVPGNYYQRVKLAWKLRPQEQHILQRLVVWREAEARLRDVPRSKLVDDNSLWNLARYKPKNKDQLAKAGVRKDIIRHDGPLLLQIVEQAQQDERELWPTILDKPLPPDAGQLLKNIKQMVAERAEALNIPPEILARKKPLEALLRSGWPNSRYQLPESMQGWRLAEIGSALLQMLNESN